MSVQFVYGKQGGVQIKKNIKQIISNQFLLSKRVDWLHFGFGTMALGREYIARVIGAKMAVSFRGYDIAFYPIKHKNCYKYVWRSVDKIHVISNEIKNLIFVQGFKNQCPVVKITPAVDTSVFFSNFKRKKEEGIQFITVARLHKVKGIHYVLEAMARLCENYKTFHYTIIGSGKEEEALRNLTIELGLVDYVSFKGQLSHNDVKENLNKADIYIQYSEHEGFCNSVLEAQAMGLLVIVSNSGGLTESVIDEYTGWVVPKSKPLDLYNKILEIIALDKNIKKRIRIQSKKRIQQDFHLEKQVQEFLKFYKLD